MPIIAIYALIAAAIFGAGYGTAWKQGQQHIAVLEASIESANYQASAALAAETSKVARLAADQEISNLQIEDEHAKNIELLRLHSVGLSDARRVWASHQPRCADSMPKVDNPGVDKRNDDAGYWLDSWKLSEGVDAIIRRADFESADHHKVIQFLKSIPEELTQ